MKQHFAGLIYDAFEKLPLKVLKADMLRYATLYIQGGIYSDSDTECIEGLDTWIGNYTDAEFIVGIERSGTKTITTLTIQSTANFN
ncbi:hypothetical protein BJ741DRAFT_592283 [Chytriomyces cf. hyalinus JEL632]|nr:hypothetical protein BJ741DRAFT_592283 [Chytriomyces cf. hyalinus JEL632]